MGYSTSLVLIMLATIYVINYLFAMKDQKITNKVIRDGWLTLTEKKTEKRGDVEWIAVDANKPYKCCHYASWYDEKAINNRKKK